MKNEKNSYQKREYMTGLMKKRSIIALCSGILELIFVFFALMMGFNKMTFIYGANIFKSYIYFTMISNTMAAISVAFVIPFAVEGIRKSRFILPEWVSVLLFVSTSSISTVLVLIACMLRYAPPDKTIGYGGLYDRILACLPFCIYMILYYIMVVVVGKERGGWDDIYEITDYINPFAGILIGTVVAYTMSLLISKLSNYLTRKRIEKKYCFWGKDVDPTEALIEAYGLGIMTAKNMDMETIDIPYDILEELAKRYDIAPSRMFQSFLKGLEAGKK